MGNWKEEALAKPPAEKPRGKPGPKPLKAEVVKELHDEKREERKKQIAATRTANLKKASEAYQAKKIQEFRTYVDEREASLKKYFDEEVKKNYKEYVDQRMQESFKEPLSNWLDSLNATSSDESDPEPEKLPAAKKTKPATPATQAKPVQSQKEAPPATQNKWARFF